MDVRISKHKLTGVSGSGYIREAMESIIDGKNIRDMLEMSVDRAGFVCYWNDVLTM